MRRMSRAEMIEEYNLTYDECHDIPDPEECPECEDGHLYPDGKERYGADADGNRWVWLYHIKCDECGYEGGSF